MFKIGDFSKLCRVPVSALRYYADIGLLEPVYIDPFTGYRYYSLDQLPRLNRILALKDLGLSLEAIARLLNETVAVSEIQGMLRLREAELAQELENMRERLNRVRSRLKQIEHENGLGTHEVLVKTVPVQAVLFIRETIPTSEHVALLIRETAGVVMGSGVELAAPPMTIFHDSEFKETDLDVEVAYPLAQRAELTFDLGNQRQLMVRDLEALPAAATLLHVGRYDNFQETYTALGRWIETNGYDIGGQPREIYLRPPGENEPALTEIQIPVERNEKS